MYQIEILSNLLGVITWDIDPAIFRAGSFQLRYYGVFFAFALAVGYFILRWQFKEEGEDPEKSTNITYGLLAGVVFGARLGHVIFYEPERYMANPSEIIMFWKGGLASHGATAGIIIVCIIYSFVYRKEPLRIILDRMAFTIPVAAICVRLGNFFNSEIVGSPTNVSWAVIFPRYDMVPRHPSQLYEASMGIIMLVLIFGVNYYYKRRNLERPLGLMASLVLISYFSMRFIVEFFKEYQVEDMIGGLRMGQVLSIPFIVAGVIGLFMCLAGPWKNQHTRMFNKRFQVDLSKKEEIEEKKA